MSQYLDGRIIVVAGSTSAAGVAVVRTLSAAGARVAAVDIIEDRVHELAAAYDNVSGYVCNLADRQSVEDLAASIRADHGPADGLIHLVGGWRGGGSIPDQNDDDWAFLNSSVLTTLRNTSRAFYDDLLASPAGRLAIVSAQSASAPTADGAAYAAVKSAAEAWTLAVADGFRNEQSGNGTTETEQRAAALIFIVKALVDDRMRAAQPERKFPGFTDVSVLAEAAELIFGMQADKLNGQRLPLKAGQSLVALS